jgi:TatD DNase family protein
MPRVVGLGETGLDFYRQYVSHDQQREAFRRHLELARLLDLPVIIHDRDAHDDILKILRDDGRGTRGVMHSFSGDLEMMHECIRLDYMISLSGPVTFRKASDKHAIAREVPLDMLMLETDCPYLTPEPYRGRRNEPAYVAYTARAIAELRGTTLDAIASATTSNTQRLFKLTSSPAAVSTPTGAAQGVQ